MAKEGAPTGKSMEHSSGFTPAEQAGSGVPHHKGGHYSGAANYEVNVDAHGNHIPQLGEYSYGHEQETPDLSGGHYSSNSPEYGKASSAGKGVRPKG